MDTLSTPLAQIAGHDVLAWHALAAALVVLWLVKRRVAPGDAAGQLRLMMSAQAAQARRVDERLEALTERMAAIDGAQAHVTDLSSRMVDLQRVLSDKQARGAFGQGRMEAIVADALPRRMYSFQATLSNGRRPDCLIAMPGRMPALAVDAKFPLEAWRAVQEAADERATQAALRRLRADIGKHVEDIAARYLVAGETQPVALMFVPSEAVLADIHALAPEAIGRAHAARIVIVSPSLLMLAVQMVQSVTRDAHVTLEAGRIQAEMRRFAGDLGTLRIAVEKLAAHHARAGQDLDAILAATEALAERGRRIDALDFDRVRAA